MAILMLGEGAGGMKVAAAAGLTTGAAVFAIAEGVKPDATTMMYSLAIAVVGLATLAFKQRSRPAPVDKISNSDLMRRLEDFAYGPRGLSERIDKIDSKIDTLTTSLGAFRESTTRDIADHKARIHGLERRRSTDGQRNAGFGG